jgi:hypothetical protein
MGREAISAALALDRMHAIMRAVNPTAKSFL